MTVNFPNLNDVVNVAIAAGNVALTERAHLTVNHKADQSEVTNADLAANALIIEQLQALAPNIPYLSEEVIGKHEYSARQSWDTFWLIDPIDGTKAFVRGDKDFSVNIALIHRHRAVLGVVHVPDQGVTYFAEQGRGSFSLDVATQTTTALQRKNNAVEADMRLVVSTYNPGVSLDFAKHAQLSNIVRSASARKMGLVAAGEADIYPRLQQCWEWDTAAGQIIVEEAGGAVLDLTGRPLTYNKVELRNPQFVVVGDRKQAGTWVEGINAFQLSN